MKNTKHFYFIIYLCKKKRKKFQEEREEKESDQILRHLPYVKSRMQPKFVTKNKQLALISYYFEYICKRTCMNKKQRAFI
jgi:hypothetical protein